MRGVLRKAMWDLRSHPMQVGLLFVVIAASAMTLSLALNVRSSAQRPYDRLRGVSEGADVWLSQLPEDFDREALLSLSSVEALSGPFPVSWENYGMRNGEKKQQFALVGMPSRPADFDRPAVIAGRWLGEDGSEEIVVDSGAAKVLDLEVGQNVTLLSAAGPESFTVVGFAAPAGRVPAPFNDPAFAYLLPETLLRFAPEPATQNYEEGYWYRTSVRLRDPMALGLFLSELRDSGYSGNLRSWQNVREDLKEINQFDVIFLTAFGVFALLAAGLIITNAVGGQVVSQLRDIGILKAIGFTPRQVMLSLVAQNLAVGLAASVTGVGLGLLLAPFFLKRSASLLGVPSSAAFDPGLLAAAVAAVLVLVALCTLLPAWRAGRISAIGALSAGTDVAAAGVSLVAVLAGRLRLPAVAVVGMKDLWRRPGRTVLTMLALVTAVVTATFSAGIETTFQRIMSDAAVIGGPPYDIIADRDLTDDGEAREILASHPEIESYLVIYRTGGRLDNLGLEIMGAEGDLNEPKWAIREGRMPVEKGEAAISTRLADEAGVGLGDNISVVAGDGEGPINVTVVGRYSDLEGRIVAVTHDSLPTDVEPSDYAIATVSGTDNRALAEALIAESGGNLDPEVIDDTVAEIRNEWRPVIYGLNAVLLFIAGVNLLSSFLLNIRERRRDFAILKTVGFTPRQIAQSVFVGSAALAVIAVVAGIPLGLVATRVMLDILSDAAGIDTSLSVMPGVLWLAWFVPIAIVVAALATVVPARRAASVGVAEALRYE